LKNKECIYRIVDIKISILVIIDILITNLIDRRKFNLIIFIFYT